MIPLNASPDLSKSLQKVRIMLDLETIPGYNTLLGHCILTAIYKKTPADEVIQFVKSQAKDNKEIVASVITPELTEMILNF